MKSPTRHEKGIRVRSTPPFKLKDKVNRQFQVINLEKQFGFKPEVIVIEKIHGINNGLVVKAVMTPEALAKEKKQVNTVDREPIKNV